MVAGHRPVTGAVLIGGASSRMGSDKADLVIAGRTMLERTLARLRAISSEVLVVAGAAQSVPPMPSVELPTRIVRDHRAHAGPLAGLEAALAACHTELLIVCAVDMPWLNPGVLELQVSIARADRALDIVTLRGERGLEPLHAVYRLWLLPQVRALLNAGERSVMALLAQARTGWPEEADLARLDPDGRSARNVNTPAALRATVAGASIA